MSTEGVVVVSKYDGLKVLKQTKARVDHAYACCRHTIPKGKIYYREHIEAVHTLLCMKPYCARCVGKHEDTLLKSQ